MPHKPIIPIDIHETRQDCFDKEIPFEVRGLRPWSYYVVEVKLSKSNVAHRVILATKGYKSSTTNQWCLADDVELYCNDYKQIIETSWRKLYWFRVVQEVPEMNINPEVS